MSVLAQRYAAALADVALEQKSADRVKNDLAAFTEAYASSADLRNSLESPSVGARSEIAGRPEDRRREWIWAGGTKFPLCARGQSPDGRCCARFNEAFQVELNARLGIAEAE